MLKSSSSNSILSLLSGVRRFSLSKSSSSSSSSDEDFYAGKLSHPDAFCVTKNNKNKGFLRIALENNKLVLSKANGSCYAVADLSRHVDLNFSSTRLFFEVGPFRFSACSESQWSEWIVKLMSRTNRWRSLSNQDIFGVLR